MSFYDDVGAFHARFDLPHAADGGPPAALGRSDLLYRIGFLLEETAELCRAAGAHEVATRLEAVRDDCRGASLADGDEDLSVDLPLVTDALVDLVYVALGTAQLKRLPFNEAWAEVHRTNLLKERGPTAARGHRLDVRKPPGWTPPRIAEILERHAAALRGER